MISEAQLPEWLCERVPAIRHVLPAAAKEHYDGDVPEVINPYFVFAFVLRPHIEALLEAADAAGLEAVFRNLEFLSNHGDPAVVNELRVVVEEELDVWKFWDYFGATMRENYFQSVSWYPEKKDRTAPINSHVDKDAYQARWRQEIERIGGFKKLTTRNQLAIRHLLVQEFKVTGMLASLPEPEHE